MTSTPYSVIHKGRSDTRNLLLSTLCQIVMMKSVASVAATFLFTLPQLLPISPSQIMNRVIVFDFLTRLVPFISSIIISLSAISLEQILTCPRHILEFFQFWQSPIPYYKVDKHFVFLTIVGYNRDGIHVHTSQR